MAKKTKKISINLTEEEYRVIELLSQYERRSISELCALIVVDSSLVLFQQRQAKGEWSKPIFTPGAKV